MTTDLQDNLGRHRGNNRIQDFGPNGERLGFFGGRGTGPGQFVHPTGVAIDCTGVLSVTDTDNNRVQQFQLATPPAAPPASRSPSLRRRRCCSTRPCRRRGPVLTVKVLRSSGVLLRAAAAARRVRHDLRADRRRDDRAAREREGGRQGQEAQGRQAGVDRPRPPEAVDPGGHVEDRAADDLQERGSEAAQGACRQEGAGCEPCSWRRPRRRGRRRVRRRGSWRRRRRDRGACARRLAMQVAASLACSARRWSCRGAWCVGTEESERE